MEFIPTARNLFTCPFSRTARNLFSCLFLRTALCSLSCQEGQGSSQSCRWRSGPGSLLYLRLSEAARPVWQIRQEALDREARGRQSRRPNPTRRGPPAQPHPRVFSLPGSLLGPREQSGSETSASKRAAVSRSPEPPPPSSRRIASSVSCYSAQEASSPSALSIRRGSAGRRARPFILAQLQSSGLRRCLPSPPSASWTRLQGRSWPGVPLVSPLRPAGGYSLFPSLVQKT